MKTLPFAAVLFAASAFSVAAPEKAEQQAQAAAEQWLAIIDAGHYPQSWKEAAPFFQGAITSEKWTEALTGVRTPLGKLVSRKLKEAKYSKSLPGAPDGDYVVVQFDTVFENKKSAVETVTPMLDKDGKWKVSGYFIR